jgi:hypothetical protein
MCLAQTVFKLSLFNTYNTFSLNHCLIYALMKKNYLATAEFLWGYDNSIFIKWMFPVSWLQNVGSFTWSRVSVRLSKNIHNTPPVVQSPLSYCL